MAKPKQDIYPSPPETAIPDGLLFQGWLSLAFLMGLGLTLEALVGFKTPAYLDDPIRRELFILAHTHGTLLSLLLIVAALCRKTFGLTTGRAPLICLRLGALLMPAGFLLGGIKHPEGDPGPGIWLTPPGALLVIFGVIQIALGARRQRRD